MNLRRYLPLVGALLAPASVHAQEPEVPAPEAVAREAAAPEEQPPSPLVEGSRPRMTADVAAERALATGASLRRVDATVMIAEAGSMQAFASVMPHLELRGRATYTSRIVNSFGQVSAAEQMLIDGAIANVTDPSAQFLFSQILGSGSRLNFPYYRSQYELSATLSYPVTASLLTLLPLYRAAGRQVDAARLQRDVERAQIALRAREAYYEHVRAQGALAIATESRDTVRAHRERVSALVDAGVASRADLLAIEAQLASAEVAVQNAALGVELSGRALSLIVSGPDEPIVASFDVGLDFAQPPRLEFESAEAIEAQALEERAELRALELAREAREMEVRAHGASRFPQLSVAGSVQFANPNTRYIPQTRQFRTSWDLSALLTWSPNDAVIAEGRRRTAAAQLAEIEAQEEDLRDAVRLEVAQAFQAYLTASATYDSTAAAVVAAEESLRVREAQLAEGVVIATELADARTALLRAQLEHVDAAVSMHLAAARLRRAIGTDIP